MPWSGSVTTTTSAWLNGTNGVEYDGPAASAYTGTSVASADVNGDGKSDLLIGSYNTGSGKGSAFIVFGMGAGWPATPTVLSAAYLNGTNGVEYDGGFANGWLGNSIAAGDVNKDGMPDIVIGAPDAAPSSNSNAGAVYTVFGRSSGCSSPGWPTSPTNLDPSAPVPSSQIWVEDNGNNRVQQFNMSGSYLSQFGALGVASGQFSGPGWNATDSSGNLWVSDKSNNRIQKFNSSGSWLLTVPGSGCAGGSPPACATGSGNGQFSAPAGIATDSSGNVWVVDGNNSRVQEFNTSGSFLLKFGSNGTGNGQFSNSNGGIAVDSSANVWVSDNANNRVEVFNSSGVFQFTFGSSGTGNGQFGGAWGIAIDGSGNAYVVDGTNTRVQKFNSSGSFLSKFGSSGSGNGQFSIPRGIAIDSNGNIWVNDNGHSRTEEFNSSGSYLSQFGSGGTGNGQFSNNIGVAIH
jgi:sugar lactone lactonase YvrE